MEMPSKAWELQIRHQPERLYQNDLLRLHS